MSNDKQGTCWNGMTGEFVIRLTRSVADDGSGQAMDLCALFGADCQGEEQEPKVCFTVGPADDADAKPIAGFVIPVSRLVLLCKTAHSLHALGDSQWKEWGE